MIMITHDLGIIAEVCDEVAVVYAGADRRAWNSGRYLTGPYHAPIHRQVCSALIPNHSRTARPQTSADSEGLMPDPTNLSERLPVLAPRCKSLHRTRAKKTDRKRSGRAIRIMCAASATKSRDFPLKGVSSNGRYDP